MPWAEVKQMQVLFRAGHKDTVSLLNASCYKDTELEVDDI